MISKSNHNFLPGIKTRRKLWLKVHLYIGLFAGVVFVLSGLAGSLAVFKPEIDAMLNPTLMKLHSDAGQTTYRPLEAIATAAKSVIPRQGKPYAFVFPSQPNEAFAVTYSLPAQAPGQTEWHQVSVNPYNANVLGQRLMFDTGDPWRGSLMSFFVRFHYTLALGEVGRTFVGIVALFLLFSLLTGLILWWPSPGKLRQALTIKRKASAERFNFDLHKTFGFYFSIPLIVILFSGLYLVFPIHVAGLVELFSPIKPDTAKVISEPGEKLSPIGLDQVAAITDKYFPDGEYKMIIFPQDLHGFYRVVKRAPQEINRTRSRRMLWLDQYSGKIMLERDPVNDAAGDVFLQWLYPLHNGEAFGVIGRSIIAITGLVPLLLYVTGAIRWLQKRKVKVERSAKHNNAARQFK
ncbi:PepSY-associated TM helix domain-containing protein [Methylomonas fluvii]|uniref:PepSY domain-containing protein n=1 Tax=Methylomonas fluvii TaxID=1854564 RepID=A0ABR9DGZ9_9GAMM|nr:PepSY-associated TM helix domain-containing protein [Methylomonas fluvii]MBD9361524.1 PepSY domain-containing protein [Methylomonas fluvii]